MKIDISTTEKLDAAILKARRNARALRALLRALGACKRRQRFAKVGLETAWKKANARDLAWYLACVTSRRGDSTAFQTLDSAIAYLGGADPVLQAALYRRLYTLRGKRTGIVFSTVSEPPQ